MASATTLRFKYFCYIFMARRYQKEDFLTFNTVILFDIENLIGGYRKADMLSSLSLKDIHNEILKKDIGRIAIQRAYANWSDPRINILRGDIIELGIEPVQMFGFGRGPQKNASDIQLVIDAVDIAYTRPSVEIFVIVSGDGGFSALAKKLLEYGKIVIGCAFKKQTNRVFEAVCNDFVWIEEPKDEFSQSKEVGEFTDPILKAFAKQFEPIDVKGEDAIKQGTQILNFLANCNEASLLVKTVGLNISIFSQALSYRIKDFNYTALGFVKFVDFIRYVSRGSLIKLVYNPPSDYRLLYHNLSIKGFSDVEPLTDLVEIHSYENYKLLLAKGAPALRLPSYEVVINLANYLSENKSVFQNILLGDIVDKLGEEHAYEQNDIKNCVISFVSAGLFLREPEETKLSEQKLSFIYQSADQTINVLKDIMYRKLKNLLGYVKDEIFAEFFV